MIEKEKRNERYFTIIILIVIILVILLFLLIKQIGFIDHKPRIPTGNVDIFDIIFNNQCNNNSSDNNNCPNNLITSNSNEKNNSTKKSNDNSTTSPKNDITDSINDNNDNNNESENDKIQEDNNGNTNDDNDDKNNDDDDDSEDEPDNPPEEEPKEGVEVFDKSTDYSVDTPLNIFKKSSYYVLEDKIAPATENSYQFVIRNYNEFNIKYSLEMLEENNYNINMKYRLKLNNNYVVGSNNEWVSYDELNQYDINLSAKNYDVYTLDWKWFESDADTEIGLNIDSKYKLMLKIMAEEI